MAYIGGGIARGGAVGELIAWALTVILLLTSVLTPAPTYFIGPGHFLDLALQVSILNLLSFPGAFVFDPITLWIPFLLMLVGAFVAGLIARSPKRGLGAAAMMFFFIAVFLFLFMVIPMGYSVDFNLVWAFVVSQLTVHWANGVGLVVSVLPLLVLGALGGLITRKKK